MIKQDFAQRVYQRMVALNLRQADLAERAGLTRNAISRYVRGITYPSQASLLELAKALECEPTDLLAESDVFDAEANRLAQELDKCRLKLHRAQNALEECLAYFEERYDVDDGENYNEAVSNAEMKMGMMIEEALGRGGRYGR